MLSLRLVGHDGGLRRRSTAADAQIQHSGSGYIPKKADLIILDTSDLTPMAYDCIRLANTATDVLKTDVGAACGQFDSEDEYLRGILAKVKEIEQNPRNYLDWRHLLDETDVGEFTKTVKVLRKHIEKTLETPSEERGEWDS